MKTKILVSAILLSSCLTSWAWFPPSITQKNIDQIRIGQSTEADLVHLFGAPTTRFVDLNHQTALDWFRSVPMPWSGYLPLIGQFLGGLNVDAQQLYVLLSPDGRVLHYEVNNSAHTLKARTQSRTVVGHTGYSK
jgi:hypothetical protein